MLASCSPRTLAPRASPRHGTKFVLVNNRTDPLDLPAVISSHDPCLTQEFYWNMGHFGRKHYLDRNGRRPRKEDRNFDE